jgi:hypothetical protein
MNKRDQLIFLGGGAAYHFIGRNPVAFARSVFGASNWIRFGSATSSVGFGTVAVGGIAGYLLGSSVLVGGTMAAEKFGVAPEGSTDHAVDFVTGNVDHWYEYTPHYNLFKIAKHHFS